MIREQIRRAQASADNREQDEEKDEERGLKRQEGEKITLSFGAKPAATQDKAESSVTKSPPQEGQPMVEGESAKASEKPDDSTKPDAKPSGFGGVSLKLGAKPQTKNVFAQAKKNALSTGSKKNVIEQPKKMSEAERIMKEEMERKRSRGSAGFGMPSSKKQKF
jgi:DNA/RNA-binding protein KIN17